MERYRRKNKPRLKPYSNNRSRKKALRMRVSKELRPDWGKDLKREEYLFIKEYLTDLNKVQAYLRSHPDCKKYTSAMSCSGALMKKDHIRKALQTALAEELDIPKHKIIQELAKQAFFNPRKVLSWDEDGDVKFTPTDNLDDDDMAAIQSVHKNNSGLHIKFADKLGAIDKLNKMLGLVQEAGDEAAGNTVIVNVIRFSDPPKKPEPKPDPVIIDVPLLEAPKEHAVP